MLNKCLLFTQNVWPQCKEILKSVRLLETLFSPLLIHSFSALGFPSIKVMWKGNVSHTESELFSILVL